ncbi:oxidoreductase, partial [Acidobacteriota bacterium]
GDGWTGRKGRVTDLIEEEIPDGADIDVYICGSSAMVEDSFRLLKEKGIPSEHIHFDKFD